MAAAVDHQAINQPPEPQGLHADQGAGSANQGGFSLATKVTAVAVSAIALTVSLYYTAAPQLAVASSLANSLLGRVATYQNSLYAAAALGNAYKGYAYATGPKDTLFIGDIEGSKALLDLVNRSDVFKKTKLQDGTGTLEVSLKSGKQVVVGGDLADHGAYELETLQFLLDLKAKYPNQVKFVIGNRDANKIRFIKELAKGEDGKLPAPNEMAVPAGKEGDKFDAWLQAKGGGEDNRQCPITRLKWILACTMGAANAFEHRRQELARLAGKSAGDVTEQEIFNSFMGEIQAGGLMRRYLEQAEVIYHDEKSKTLYVHGGITKEAFGLIPGKGYPTDKTQCKKVDTLKEYREGINQFAKEQMQEVFRDGESATELMWYLQFLPESAPANQESAIYAANQRNCNLELPEEDLQDKLIKGGADKMVVGHRPAGKVPMTLSNGRFALINADNSHQTQERHMAEVRIKDASTFVVNTKYDLVGKGEDGEEVYRQNLSGSHTMHKTCARIARWFTGRYQDFRSLDGLQLLYAKDETYYRNMGRAEGFAIKYYDKSGKELEIADPQAVPEYHKLRVKA